MAKKYRVKPPVPIGEALTEKCKHCGGSGQEPGLTDLTCRECIGRGRRKWRIEACSTCGGRGKTGFLSLSGCKMCNSRGWTMRDIG